jgi:hypothetical protein
MAKMERVVQEMFENWSVRWQTLQRSLAESFGAEADLGSRATAKPVNLPGSGLAAPSWIVRARHSAFQDNRAGQ